MVVKWLFLLFFVSLIEPNRKTLKKAGNYKNNNSGFYQRADLHFQE
jgi:hypothetical protein